MSVKGFKLDDGSIAKYDYNSLENITTDTTLSSSGVAADAKAVGDELSDLLDQISDLSDTVDGNNTTVTEALSGLEEGKLNYIGVVPSSGNTTTEISSIYGSVAAVVQEVWSSLPIGHTPFVVKIAATGGNLLCLGMRYGDTGQYGMLYFNHYYVGSGSVNVNNNVFTEHRTKPTIQTFVSNFTLSGAGWAKITLPGGGDMTYPTYKVLNCYTATTAGGANIILNTTLYSANGTTTWWIKAINGNTLATVASISVSVEVAYIKV